MTGFSFITCPQFNSKHKRNLWLRNPLEENFNPERLYYGPPAQGGPHQSGLKFTLFNELLVNVTSFFHQFRFYRDSLFSDVPNDIEKFNSTNVIEKIKKEYEKIIK